MHYEPDINVIALIGLTITEITQINGEMYVRTADHRTFRFYHDQDCCESVGVYDIKGNLEDLVGSPILGVVETIKSGSEHNMEDWPTDIPKREYVESFTWTTFTFSTAKGTATVRWLGESNGYYGESVSFQEVK